MEMKDFIKNMLYAYFIVVTLICICMFVLGSVFLPDVRFGYDAFASPLINGFLGMLPVCVMYSRKELSIKQMIIRKAIQLILIEAIMIYIQLRFGADEKSSALTISLAVSILIIFVVSHVIGYILDARQAADLNRALEHYKQVDGEL